MFRTAPFLFFWSGAFKTWRREKERRDRLETARRRSLESDAPFDPAPDPVLEGFVARCATAEPVDAVVEAFAFYDAGFFDNREKGKGAADHYDSPRAPEIIRQQADMARAHGVAGFCFYTEWRGDDDLPETPLKLILADPSLRIEFCLCWRDKPDGAPGDAGSKYLVDFDAKRFIKAISPYLRDERYLRIDGKPALVIERPQPIKGLATIAADWRKRAAESGIGGLHLLSMEAGEEVDPSVYGLDGVVEAAPNMTRLAHEPELAPGLPDSSRIRVYDWRKAVGAARARRRPAYRFYRSVNTGYDNTAKRPDDGVVLVGSSPSTYRRWLEFAAADTIENISEPDQRLVFINAWNAWSDGAHLEPDEERGYAWLEATRRALSKEFWSKKDRKIIIAIHDLHQYGAQFLALHLARTFRDRFGMEVVTIAADGGALADEFRREGDLYILDQRDATAAEFKRTVAMLAARDYRRALLNSAACGWLAEMFHDAEIETLGLVHEMREVVQTMALERNLRDLNRYSKRTVFAAPIVAEESREAAGLAEWRAPVIRPQGLHKGALLPHVAEKEPARRALAARLGVDEEARFVLGVGYGDHRKGVDLFADWAAATGRDYPRLYFIWLGEIAPEMSAIIDDIRKENRGMRLLTPGFVDDTEVFYKAASFYALSSREDPFPSTALEALGAGAPVICVSGTGGVAELRDKPFIAVMPDARPRSFIDAASPWLSDEAAARRAGEAGRDWVAAGFGFESYAGDLLRLIDIPVPKISAVVPSYNYGRYLAGRLQSIVSQSVPLFEIIVIDDASQDDSVTVAREFLSTVNVNWRIIENATNSGDVFGQWRRGVEATRGDYVWIAEADDLAEPRFLETALEGFADESVALSYVESKQMNAEGVVSAANYADYLRDISEAKWRSAYRVSGEEEAAEALSIRNTIPNVSAALFRRAPLLETLSRHSEEISSFKSAGDWCVYAYLLRGRSIAFTPEPLNYHRRHADGVTLSKFDLRSLSDIARMQRRMASLYSIPTASREAAARYLNELIAHFDLSATYPESALQAAKEGGEPSGEETA